MTLARRVGCDALVLRLPPFQVEEPASLDAALALLAAHGERARVMAGGTDLLPNMKHELVTPEVVVGLWRVPGLRGVEERGGELVLGAMSSLHALSEDEQVWRHAPSLAEACAQVAGPQLRRMGTLGGNVCLDTRCVYINQTYFWRQALGFCLKKDGTKCHVVQGGRRCVAAASNDTGPVLMSLGARLALRSSAGERQVAIDDFYTTDGVFNQERRPDELLTHVIVPIPPPRTLTAYLKLRTRAAIDFPELGVAVLAGLDEGGRLNRADICLTALGSRPVHVKGLDAVYGRPLDEESIQELGRLAFLRAKPLTNIAGDPSYRREMVPVYVRRAFRAALARARA